MSQLTFDPSQISVLLKSRALQGLEIVAKDILERSLVIVPVDNRPDKNATVLKETAQITPDSDSVYVSYDTEYAVRQHEELDYYHEAPTQARFLAQPLEETRIEEIQAAIKAALGL